MALLRILTVDDQEAFRLGVRALLSSRPDWLICGEAEDGIQAVESARTLRRDVVVMDVSMPRMNGLEATQAIRRELPEANPPITNCEGSTRTGQSQRRSTAQAGQYITGFFAHRSGAR